MILFTVNANAQTLNKVLLFVSREGSGDMEFMLTNEVGVMMDMLKEAGYEVKVALPLGKPLVGGKTTLNPDLDLADVKVSDYLGFVMPCMGQGGLPIFNESFEIVKQAVLEEKPIAAQQSAIEILAQSGALKGRKYVYAQDLGIDGATYCGIGVVADKMVVTSAVCPEVAKLFGLQDGTSELIKEFVALLPSRIGVESKSKLAILWGVIKTK